MFKCLICERQFTEREVQTFERLLAPEGHAGHHYYRDKTGVIHYVRRMKRKPVVASTEEKK
jgi:hypothetical protein